MAQNILQPSLTPVGSQNPVQLKWEDLAIAIYDKPNNIVKVGETQYILSSLTWEIIPV